MRHNGASAVGENPAVRRRRGRRALRRLRSCGGGTAAMIVWVPWLLTTTYSGVSTRNVWTLGVEKTANPRISCAGGRGAGGQTVPRLKFFFSFFARRRAESPRLLLQSSVVVWCVCVCSTSWSADVSATSVRRAELPAMNCCGVRRQSRSSRIIVYTVGRGVVRTVVCVSPSAAAAAAAAAAATAAAATSQHSPGRRRHHRTVGQRRPVRATVALRPRLVSP